MKEKGGCGVFARLLIRGLAGDADTDVNGVVHFEELASWLRPLVYNRSGNFKQTVKYGKLTPGAGEPVFLVPSDKVRQQILGKLTANEVKANLIKRCGRKGRDCLYLARGDAPGLGRVLSEREQSKPESDVLLKLEALRNDRQFWESVKDSTNPKMFEAYLSKFANGEFATLATIKLEELKRGQVASLRPPKTKPPPAAKPGLEIGRASCRERV